MDTELHGKYHGNLIDLEERSIVEVKLYWENGHICSIERLGDENRALSYLLPGFIDAHVHIESAMLPPSEFGRLALIQGTVGAVTDPHEIANVMGMDGVKFMLEDAKHTPFHAYFGAPSCVPATPFETAYGSFGCDEIAELLNQPQVCCLSEMMNFPGVLERTPSEMAKIAVAQRLGYPVDGHAPGLKGDQARAYVEAGVGTDHECYSMEEARDKIAAGMCVLIREGSAARNFDTLQPLISESPNQVMFCSDDKHPDDLVQGHIRTLVVRALRFGHDLFDVLRCACFNPIKHYSLDIGQLRVGDPMDAIEVSEIESFTLKQVWASGTHVVSDGELLLKHQPVDPVNRFHAQPITEEDLSVSGSESELIRVMQVRDGSLVTHECQLSPKMKAGVIQPDTERDLLLICVVNRYEPQQPAVGFIQGFGLKRGAIASSIAHDSHNIVAVGANVESICNAVNAIIDEKGGVAIAVDDQLELLPLPIAGLMSNQDGFKVAARYAALDEGAKALGSSLSAPFMSLSFMALLVIPELKLSDQGLFDGNQFQFVPLWV